MGERANLQAAGQAGLGLAHEPHNHLPPSSAQPTAGTRRSLYEVLGVTNVATLREIKVAYKKKAQQTHPDKGGDPTGETFREVNNAYQILSDDVKRRRYDEAQNCGVSHDFVDMDINPFDLFAAFFASEPKAAEIRDVLEINMAHQRTGCVLSVLIEPEVMNANGEVQQVQERVQVRIPPGVRQGEFVPVLNKGCQEQGKLPGDWLFGITIVAGHDDLVPGQVIQTIGLQSPELNGVRGVLITWSAKDQNWQVALETHPKNVILLRRANLQAAVHAL